MERLDGVHGVSNNREDASLAGRLNSIRNGHEEAIFMFAERITHLIERAYPKLPSIKGFSDRIAIEK